MCSGTSALVALRCMVGGTLICRAQPSPQVRKLIPMALMLQPALRRDFCLFSLHPLATSFVCRTASYALYPPVVGSIERCALTGIPNTHKHTQLGHYR